MVDEQDKGEEQESSAKKKGKAFGDPLVELE